MEKKFVCILISLTLASFLNAQITGGGKINSDQEQNIQTIKGNSGLKKPGVSTILSILLPGAGQYYNGQNIKGGIMTAGYSLGVACAVAGLRANSGNGHETLTALGIGLVIVSEIYSIIDAPINANKINEKVNSGMVFNYKNAGFHFQPHLTYFDNLQKPFGSIFIGCKLSVNIN
jgi:hypothetical protein